MFCPDDDDDDNDILRLRHDGEVTFMPFIRLVMRGWAGFGCDAIIKQLLVYGFFSGLVEVLKPTKRNTLRCVL